MRIFLAMYFRLESEKSSPESDFGLQQKKWPTIRGTEKLFYIGGIRDHDD